jgi:hypothetical protein
MADRSWFVASGGKQEGPYSESVFRDLIGQGRVTPDTLVWSEGMTDWQRASDIPGLFSSSARPPAFPNSGPPQMRGSYAPGGPLAVEFGILDFTWRTLVLIIGMALVIPGPWVIAWYCRWMTTCVQVPGRPNLTFTGATMTLVIWYFGMIAVFVVLGLINYQIESSLINLIDLVVGAAFNWAFLRWFVANLASDGQPLGLKFSGSYLAYLGWTLLTSISFITIIGWAWVFTAQGRWTCRNIEGTRRAVVYNASGLQVLWRTIVTGIVCSLIIPIPWMVRWLTRWHASQVMLTERTNQ